MAKYDKKTISYVTVEYTMTISFPSDKIACDLCPFCHTENSGTRFRCVQTGEILPFHNVDYGLRCPLPIPQTMPEGGDEDSI